MNRNYQIEKKKKFDQRPNLKLSNSLKIYLIIQLYKF